MLFDLTHQPPGLEERFCVIARSTGEYAVVCVTTVWKRNGIRYDGNIEEVTSAFVVCA